MGCFFKLANAPGAIVGASAGFLAGLWISLGSYFYKPNYPKLDVTTEYCNQTFNQSILSSFQPYYSSRATNLSGFNTFYSLSYMLYTTFGLLVTVVVGLAVSLCTKGHRQQVDDSLLLVDLVDLVTCKPCKNKKKKRPESEQTVLETRTNKSFITENGDTVSSL